MVVFGGGLVDAVEAVIFFLAFLFAVALRRQGYPGAFGQHLLGLGKIAALFLHNEREDVAAGAAGAEAVPGLLVGIDEKGAVLLAVEGAQPLEAFAGTAELGVLADDLYDVYFLLDFVNNAHS